MEKKQTAVQFIHEAMNMRQLSLHQFDKLFEQALQMEREQIEEAYWQGHNDLVNYNRKDIDTSNISISAPDYYTQTFKP